MERLLTLALNMKCSAEACAAFWKEIAPYYEQWENGIVDRDAYRKMGACVFVSWVEENTNPELTFYTSDNW